MFVHLHRAHDPNLEHVKENIATWRERRDNGGEFINEALIGWAHERDLYFTRARPYHSNDNAHVEQKNGDVVRRHAFHYRYDTATELRLLNDLYALVRVRLNPSTATTKAIGWRANRNGKNVRVYDSPSSTPAPSPPPRPPS